MKNFECVQRGDILQNTGSGDSYVVADIRDKQHLILVKTIVASNPPEWKKFCLACRRIVDE